jgi:trk system potassium uptake protein
VRVVILGCGRLGAKTAELLDAAGHEVTMIDQDAEAFRRLSPAYRGRAIVGVGIDDEILRQANAEEADVFISLTGGDNTNIMACQVARHAFEVPHVICQIKDPIRGEAYQKLGVTTVCPTIIGADDISRIFEQVRISGR